MVGRYSEWFVVGGIGGGGVLCFVVGGIGGGGVLVSPNRGVTMAALVIVLWRWSGLLWWGVTIQIESWLGSWLSVRM